NAIASHMQIFDAWKLETGKKSVIVAVIDTGIDPNHVDLKTNLWKKIEKSGEKTVEIYGYDFTKSAPNPLDEHGHGTHVAGIIGAVTNPQKGISGVAPNISLMALKFYSDSLP